MLPHEKKFVETLNRAISDAGLNKSELARKAGISHPQLFRYFKGVVPRYPVLERLAEALGVSPTSLLAGLPVELQPTSDITPEETFLIRETPAMYSKTPSSVPLPSTTENNPAKQTADEIYSRLLQLATANPATRRALLRQINMRIEELKQLCDDAQD
jgi:transcriptional regulator with XRE-family HTH domain